MAKNFFKNGKKFFQKWQKIFSKMRFYAWERALTFPDANHPPDQGV